MSGFERHGLTHWSASTHNLATNALDVFVAEKLFGKRGQPSPAMYRGIAVEDGVAHCLLNGVMDDAIAVAHASFDKHFPFSMGDASVKKERDGIAAMVELATEAILAADLGPVEWPEQGQHKITIEARGENWTFPVIGYLDFKFPGTIVDLKTTHRMPSEMSPEHQRQRAIYAGASGNHAVRFLYVTPKKAEWREDGDPPQILAEIKTQMNRIERFLNLGDRDLLASIVPVNPSSFYWRGNEATRLELFGL